MRPGNLLKSNLSYFHVKSQSEQIIKVYATKYCIPIEFLLRFCSQGMLHTTCPVRKAERRPRPIGIST